MFAFMNFTPIPESTLNNNEFQTPIAYFDFDDTLMPGDSILYWKRFYFRQKPFKRFFQVITWIGILGYVLRLIRSTTLKRIFLLPVSYEKEIESLSKKFVLEELKSRLYPEMLQRLREHEALGHKIVLISASATFYLRYLKELFPNAVIIGTPMNFPKKGFFRLPSYSEEWGNLKGEAKVRYILKNKEFPNSGKGCYGYSDGHTDKFLLEFTEFPFAVQPDAKMEKIAQEKKWPILRPFFAQNRQQRNLAKLKTMISDLGHWPKPNLFTPEES